MGRFAVVLLALVLYAFTVGAVNWIARSRVLNTASRYIVLLVGALVPALALLHLHTDMILDSGHRDIVCWPLWILTAMGLLSIGCITGFVYRQQIIARSLARWSENAPESIVCALIRLVPHFRLSKIPELKLVTAEAPMALTVGILHPRIYLSTGLASRLGKDELEGVLAHELAHIARADNLIAFISTALTGAIAILPYSWRSLRLLLAERELAADALATAVTGKPITLARALLKVADGTHIDEPGVACLLDPALVEQRVQHLIALHHCAPTSKSPDLEPKRIAALTLLLPPVLAWLLFAVPHLLQFP
jgi:Zn-dependent protease with chaperone function